MQSKPLRLIREFDAGDAKSRLNSEIKLRFRYRLGVELVSVSRVE